VEAKLVMNQNGVPVINRWYVDVGHAVTPTDLSGVFAVIDAWVTAHYSTIVHTSIKFDQIICTDVSVANGQQDIQVPTTLAGTVTGSAEAANAALVASLRTAHTGRGYRGRTYIPGLSTTYLTDAQHVSTTYVAFANVAFVDLVNAMVTAGYKLCVLSRWLNKVLRTVGLLTEIITIITDTKVDSQRRRTAN
jgi:hypothetical protein